MTEAMDAEFDTVAGWTADVALELGPDYHVIAGCRGSGSPAALDWLVENLQLRQGESFLDSGAGVGGPAAYLARLTSARPTLVDPAAGACRSARRLFGLPVARATADALPFGDAAFGALWCLGVLCTTDVQTKILAEARRVLTAHGRLGLLVFIATSDSIPSQPSGNHFPTRDELGAMIDAVGLATLADTTLSDIAEAPAEWQRREDEIDAELQRRHGNHPAWRSAAEQQQRMSTLIGAGDVVGQLLVVNR